MNLICRDLYQIAKRHLSNLRSRGHQARSPRLLLPPAETDGLVLPFDAGMVQDIERALKESKIGITPAVDGKIIRLPIPELSEERRKDLVRSLGRFVYRLIAGNRTRGRCTDAVCAR